MKGIWVSGETWSADTCKVVGVALWFLRYMYSRRPVLDLTFVVVNRRHSAT